MDTWVWISIAAVVGALVASAALTFRTKRLQSRLDSSEADRIRLERSVEVAREEAELAIRKESVELRERSEAELRRRSQELDEDYGKRMAALTRLEEKLSIRDDSLEARRAALDSREQELLVESKTLQERVEAFRSRDEELKTELHRIANLSREEARNEVLRQSAAEHAELVARQCARLEASLTADVEDRARRTMVDAMQRSATASIATATVAVVELPSEDMKGRIIGRDGRNIRAFEQVTGVDLIVDETPEAVVISCFDPVRRETARLTLMNLMLDGRIHPAKIEELFQQAQSELERAIAEAGQSAADQANVHGLAPATIKALGKLRFRSSYAQNVLSHSVEVSRLCAMLAAEIGANVEIAKRAGLLHDIGKSLPEEWEGPHAMTGMEFLRSVGEREAVLHAVGAHHYDIEPTTDEAHLVIVADTISASRPGARRESLDNYIKRLTNLEALANSFEGVERSYALQAGRELRVLVRPTLVDDPGAAQLAEAIARRIEAELEYPGPIKVTVIRETRANDTAR